MENGKSSAFPFVEPPTECAVSGGVTKREYFAGLAMQGLLAGDKGCHLDYERVADWSVKHVDALLVKLAESEAKPATAIQEIRDAYVWIRQNNQSISDDTLDLMKNAAIAAIESEAQNV